MKNEIMTVREVAAYLKIKEKTAYRLTADGKIPGFKVGGSWRYKRTTIDQWIENQVADQNGGENVSRRRK